MEKEFILAVAITTAVFQTVKQVDVEERFKRFYPVSALLVGVAVGLLFDFAILVCVIVGVTANGTYNVVKEPVKLAKAGVEEVVDKLKK